MKNSGYLFRAAIIAVLSFQLASCGTIMYPERRHQKPGRIDLGVTVLDTLLLFFGIIPGVIAFAVDFSSGAIYFPDDRADAHANHRPYRVVRFDARTATKASLEALISRETGTDFHFNDKRARYRNLKNTDEVSLEFSKFEADSRMAMNAAVVK